MAKTKLTPDVQLDALTGSAVHHGRTRKRRLVSNHYDQAAQVIGPLEPGCEIFGFTRGQFSISDVIQHVLTCTGPARVDIATWTASDGDIKRAENLLADGRITRIRFIVDPSFKTRKPIFCGALTRAFGSDCIRTINSHAKFVTVRNDGWNLVIRTSMNLNPNPRLENFEISDDRGFADFFGAFVDQVFEAFSPEEAFTSQSRKQLDRVTGGQAQSASALPFTVRKLPF